MATLLTARDLTKSYDSRTLFRGVSMQLVEDDRLGVIGPNGAGKSTLLKILAGLEDPDEGEVTRRRGLRQVYIPQDDVFDADATPRTAVTAHLSGEHAGAASVDAHDAQHELDPDTRASIALSRLGFTDIEQPVHTLSGGWKKRLSIACALVHDPDVLMLDEPTNHLDLEGIAWLERFVRQSNLAMVFITHDRRFLENVAQRIIELAPAYPDGMFEVKGNYTEFVRRKDEFIDAQAAAESALANKVRRDIAWMRQGIQGRQTRNKTQVEAGRERQAELKAVRDRNEAPQRTTTIDFQATERKTNKLLTLHGVQKSMGDRSLFQQLDLSLTPGVRLGLVGENGAGKTTLLRLLSGELEPDAGTIKRAANLRVVTFTQHRASLQSTDTLQQALCHIGDVVEYRGKQLHVTGWAKKFLFSPDQLSTFVGNLSGGEQARVLIAQLMLEPADVLLLDEPTNDLDIPSLEVLEQALLEFPGAIVLVTHDRFMLERIATEYLALDGAGAARWFASLEHWQQSVAQQLATQQSQTKQREKKSNGRKKQHDARAGATRRLTFAELHELRGMEDAIVQAEQHVEKLEARSHDPAIMADHVQLAETYQQLAEAQQQVQELYDRWAELDALQQASS